MSTAELWVRSPDGDADERRVTRRPDPSDPAWTPDGRLSFSSRGEIFVADPEGDRPARRIAAGGCPLWTQGGSLVLCAARNPVGTATVVRLVDEDGSPIRQLASDRGELRPTALTADGASLALTDAAGVARLIDVEGGPARVLAEGPGWHSAEVFLRDGSWVMAEAQRDRPARWFRVMPDGERRPLPALDGVEDRIDIRQVGTAAKRAVVPATARSRSGSAERGGLRDVGGHRIWVRCSGHGSPTVVFVSGLGVDSEDTWASVAGPVSRRTRVCEYNRPGVGLSPAVRPPRDAAHMAKELAALVDSVAPRGRLVLVGASLGGLVTQIYAGARPERIAGVVLVDSLHPRSNTLIERAIGTPAAAENRRILSQNVEGARWSDLVASYRQAAAARPFPAVPLVVLKHGISFDPGGRPVPAVERIWGRLQLDLAQRSPHGRLVVARRSHHRIAEDQPGLVVDAILSVL
jgi:pimeloyl-ACP methyl ester carboxylesterase